MIIVEAARIAEYKAKGWWGDTTLIDKMNAHADARPQEEALVDPPNLAEIAGIAPRRLTWQEVRDGVEQRAALLHKSGLRKDDVIVIQLPNSVDLTLALLACFRLGVIASPAPAQYRQNELAGIVRRTGASGAIMAQRIGRHDHAALLAAVRAGSPGLRHCFLVGPGGAGAPDLADALAALEPADVWAMQAAVAQDPPTADDVATICWTSGTEAEPKGVPRNHNEWMVMGQGCMACARLRPGDRTLNPFPMVNMAGISTGLCTWLEFGGTLVQHHPFDLPVFLSQIKDERINYTVAPPALLTALLSNDQLLKGIDFGLLRRLGSGSAPLSDWMVRSFHERHGVEVINIFGSNEGAAFAACLEDVPDPKDRAIHFPRLGDHGFNWSYTLADRTWTRLVDPETGHEITAPGMPGELRVKGPGIFSGYWQAPDVTSRSFDAEGWFCTGDLFAIAGDRNQYYRFVGRLKDIVIRGGMNISAEEIERYLIEHPAVRDVAVIGYPDHILGEKLLACVVPAGDGPTMAELNRFLVEEKKIALFKQIERLELLDELPRNPVGKLLKRELRTAFSGNGDE